MSRLEQQMAFALYCDRLKTVQRSTLLHDGSRRENSAEHSWQLAVLALTLGEYAPPGTDLSRVMELVLIHDLVEIDAGDTFFAASPETLRQQAEQEAQAAAQLFALLPADQSTQFEALWQEFEADQSPEARFARALDAFQPMLLSWGPGGLGCLHDHPELTRARVLALKEKRLKAFPELWAYAQKLLQDAVNAGLIAP